jgi:hypothetical protein
MLAKNPDSYWDPHFYIAIGWVRTERIPHKAGQVNLNKRINFMPIAIGIINSIGLLFRTEARPNIPP